MTIFTFHLVKQALYQLSKHSGISPQATQIPGLIHAECMTAMKLGSLRSFFRFSGVFWGKPVEMESMVQGHSSVLKPKRHADAIKERKRKDFHFQSTTLRFKAIAEYGEWEGQTNVLPGLTR